MPPTPDTVEVDFITPRHLAGGGDPAWITVPSTAPADGATATTP
ncbi:hypothetical protein [Streptomyces cucumeris]